MPAARKDLDTHRLHNTKPQYVAPESDVEVGRPKYPRGISGEAKAAFKRLVRLLEQRGVCTSGDVEIIRLYAHAYDRHSRALEHLATEGEIITVIRTDNNGTGHEVKKANGWLEVLTTAEKFMRGCLADLGLNPLQRAKVSKPKAEPPKEEQLPTREETALVEEPEPDLYSDELTQAIERLN
jgi:P27 family predicted phage terminase small subunit